MRLQTPDTQPPAAPSRPSAAETAQRWQDVGGIEGISLEWMLDRTRAPQEARQ